jgi:hypothetical protein
MPNDTLTAQAEAAAEQYPVEHDFVDAANDALAADPTLYVQRGRLVEIRAGARVVPLTDAGIREHLSRSALWRAFLAGRRRTIPGWLPWHLRKQPDWPRLRPLRGVTTAPLFRADGSILETPGYDAATGLFFAPDIAFEPVPERVSVEDMLEVWKDIRPMLSSVAENSITPTLTAFLAALLTPFARCAFDGPAPIFVFDAPTETCAAQRLVDLIGRIVTGRPMLRMEKPATERGFRRQAARVAPPDRGLVVLDSIDSLRSLSALRAAVQRLEWIDGPPDLGDARPVTWYATSTNVLLSIDASAAIVPVRTEAPDDLLLGPIHDLPADLEARVIAARPRIVRGMLMILRGFHQAGRPQREKARDRGFRAWFELVADALYWAGGGDIAVMDDVVKDSIDDDMAELRALMEGIADADSGAGVTVPALLDIALQEDPKSFGLRRALELLLPGKLTARRIGALLKRLRGRQIEGCFITSRERDRHGYALWCIAATPEGIARMEAWSAAADKGEASKPPPPQKLGIPPSLADRGQVRSQGTVRENEPVAAGGPPEGMSRAPSRGPRAAIAPNDDLGVEHRPSTSQPGGARSGAAALCAERAGRPQPLSPTTPGAESAESEMQLPEQRAPDAESAESEMRAPEDSAAENQSVDAGGPPARPEGMSRARSRGPRTAITPNGDLRVEHRPSTSQPGGARSGAAALRAERAGRPQPLSASPPGAESAESEMHAPREGAASAAPAESAAPPSCTIAAHMPAREAEC